MVCTVVLPRSPTQKLYTVPELVDLEARLLAWANPRTNGNGPRRRCGRAGHRAAGRALG